MTTSLANIEDGRTRYAAIISFNEHFYHTRATDKNAMLSSVAHISRTDGNGKIREAHSISKLVMTYMINSKWVETYGLSYLETLELTYSEWMRMQDALNISTSTVVTNEIV
jgi:hypothetical protein